MRSMMWVDMAGRARFWTMLAVAICSAMLLVPASAGALQENSACLSCHSTMLKVDFNLAPVAKDTVCKRCHLNGFVGAHPKHQGGGNCAACHPGFGQSLDYAVPTVLDTGGAFASNESQNLPSYIIHTIHATPRWPSNIKKATSACSSCHATAACSTCHGDIIDLTHSQHGSLSTSTSIGASWVGNVSPGVTAFEHEDTLLVGQAVRCGAGGCHDTDGLVAAAPNLMDCYPHDAYPALGYISTRGLITRSGTWMNLSSGSLGRETFTNYTTAWLQIIFTGERVSIVSSKDPYRGIGRVFIDGVDMGTFDEYAPTTQYEKRVWTSPELTAGTHTIKVVPTGSKNVASRSTFVGLDHIEVQEIARDAVSPPCTECHVAQGDPSHGGMDHGYTTLNQYDNLTQTGCTNSGAGCHASASTGDAVTTFHPEGKITCLDSGCHTSVTMDATWKAANTGAECNACHAGNFVNAVDTTGLADVAPAGHYSETTHTAAGSTSTVSAGGTYSAACTACHNPASATSIDGLYNQHQGLGGGLGDTTCADCHNANAAIAALVKDATRTDTCTACHSAGVLPTMVQHGSTAPAVAGTESCGAGSCATTGCHATVDVHALHKSNNSGNANGCMMADCHDAATQGWKPTAKSCGTAGACHSVDPIHPSEAAAHTTLASAECVVCHEMGGDLKLTHGNQCSTCHGRPGLNVLGKLECTSCHNGTDVGLHVYSPIDPNHYTGTETTHTASGSTNSTDTSSGGFTCVTCHKMEMKPEHITKTSSAFATATAAVDKCIACHETKVDALGAYPSWNKTCTACHATKHTATATKHDASTVGAACGGGSCHTISDVAVIHANSVVQSPVDNPSSCVSACHVNNDNIPTSITCVSAGCHEGGHAHPLDTAASVGCYDSGAGCHNSANLDYAVADYHPTANSTCLTSKCHTAANHNDPSFNNPVGCLECHDSQYNNAPDVVPTSTVHYVEATHTALGMTTAVGTYTYNNKCSNCHTADLKSSHTTTTIGTIGCTTGGSADNEGCHNDTDLGTATAQVIGSWTNDLCSDCHTTSHATYTLVTHTAAATAGCTLSSGCHGSTGNQALDVRGLHDRSGVGCTATGTDSKGWTGACHAINTPMSGALTCGNTGGCHSSHTSSNHGSDHNYDATTNYTQTADTVGSEAGCTASGAGCHASAATGDAVETFHAAVKTGCMTTDACHSDPQFADPTWKTGTTANCSRCHGGVTDPGIGRDVQPLYEAASAGHYGENTHTATSMATTINAGGTRTAACTVCHASTYRDAHGAVGTSFASTTKGAYITCQECHGYNAAVSSITTDTVRHDTCSACHTGTVLGVGHVVHGNAPVTAGTGTSCASTGVNCHGSDLHVIHKDATSCALTGCHAANKDMTAATKSCGSAGTGTPCHSTYTKANHYATYIARHTSAVQGAVTTTVAGVSPTCGSCHGMELNPEHVLANSTLTGTGADACEKCHGEAPGTFDIATDNWTGDVCSACHGQPGISSNHTNMAGHNVANAGCGASGAGCHPTQDLAQAGANKSLYIHNDCATCHDPAGAASWSYGMATNLKYNPLVKTCGGATGCHTAGFYTTTLHKAGQAGEINGNDTTHTAASMTTKVGAYTYNNACSSCHSSGLRSSHTTTSIGAVGCTTGGSGDAEGCHNDTDLGTAPTQVKSNWTNDLCSDCHTASHTTYTDGTHTASANAGCTLQVGCHGYTGTNSFNVRTLHDASAAAGCTVTGTDGQGWNGACHSLDKPMASGALTCGGGLGCHANHTDASHGPDHDYTAASNYTQTADTVGSEAGCTNSGSGCHVSAATGDAVTTFHNNVKTGCMTTDACHGDPQFDATFKLGSTANCSRCHNATAGIGADKQPLYEAASAGHYGETTHTATSMATTINAGGTRTAACTVCHASTYRDAHGAVGTSFASTTKGAYITCQECHGYNAAVSSITTDTVRHDTCSACHTGTVLGATHVVHGNAPVTAGSGTSCASTGVNCHGSDLHSIHKDATSCALTGCHAANKDMTSATKSCGSVTGGCHSAYTQANHYATYITRHTSSVQGAVTTAVAGVSPTCGSCHGMELNPEHVLSSSALTGTGATVCEKCHGEAPGTFDLAVDNWVNDLCSDCHGQPGISSSHTNMAGHNVVNTGCGASGAGCHPTQDLAQAGANKSLYIHNDCATCHDPAGAASWSYGMATNLKYNPLVKTCGGATGCHTAGFYTTTLHKAGQAGEVNGNDTTHTAASMTTTVGAYTYNNACSSCHSSGLRSSHTTTSIGAVGCTTGGSGDAEGCHNDTDLGTAPAQVKSNWTNDLCSDCHTASHNTYTLATHTSTASGCTLSGTCHGFDGTQTLDIRVTHDGVGVGCTASGTDSNGWTGGCHQLDKPMAAGALTCGDTGTCHINHTATNHMPVHDANDALSVGCTINGCHETGPTKSVDTTSVISQHATDTIGTLVSGKTNDGCNICHGGSGWADVAATSKSTYGFPADFYCVNCHEGVLLDSLSPYNPDHYTGSATTHTASSQTGTEGSVACNWCHNLEMKPEHMDKTSSAFASLGYADKCVQCHEEKVDALAQPWVKTCDSCHAIKHDATATKHNAQAAGFGASCYAVGSTTVQTLHSENFDSVTAPAWPTTWTKGGTDPTLLVTSSASASSTPNAARFASDTTVAKSATFTRTFDTSALTDPKLSFAYSTSFASGGSAQATIKPDAVTSDVAAWLFVSGSKVQAVEMVDTTNYIYNATARDRNEIVYSVADGQPGWIINSVTMYVTALDEGTRGLTASAYVNAAVLDSLAPALTTAFNTYSKTLIAPAGGWNPTNLATLGVGLKATNNVNSTLQPQVDAVWFVVDYQVAVDPALNYLKAEVYNGSTWNTVLTQDTDAAWTTYGPAALPINANVQVRFTMASDATDRVSYVDDIIVQYDQVTSGCHNIADVGAIHANSIVGNAKLETAGDGCKTCHTNNTTLPTTLNCSAVGCHAVSPHRHDLDTATSAGCYNTGAGCHNSASLLYDDAAYHPTGNSLCLTSGCHTSSSQPLVAFDNPVGCLECHNAQYNNARDVVPTETVHYVEATHTAQGMGNLVGAYTYNNACTDCHTSGLKSAHTTTTIGTIGCTTGGSADNEGCHNDTDLPATLDQIKTSNWTNDFCSDCHTTSHDAYTLTKHTATAGTSCSLDTCHGGATDVRTVHERVFNNAGATSNGCTAAGSDAKGTNPACHALNKAMNAVGTMSCGTTTGTQTTNCHVNYTSSNHGVGGLCFTCHANGTAADVDVEFMENSTLYYHHVLDAVNNGTLPDGTTNLTSTSVLGCTSCHTNHTWTGTTKSSNLKTAVGETTITNTDKGLCLSCHDTVGLIRTQTEQKAIPENTANYTMPQIGTTAYNASLHAYVINDPVKVGFNDGTAFQANCLKCHDDGMTTTNTWQSGTYKLTLHYSNEWRLANALGLVSTTATEEALCYKCHTGGTAGNDAFGVQPMTARARGIEAAFAKTSKHNVAGYAGIHQSNEYALAPTSIGQATASPGWWDTSNAKKHVECEDCHNVHEAKAATNSLTNDNASPRTTLPAISGANLGVWGVTVGGTGGDWNGSATIGGGAPVGPTYTKEATSAYEWQMCLKCHSRFAWGNQGAPAVPSGGMNNLGASTMTDVGKDFDPANYAYHPVFRAGLNTPLTTANTAWTGTLAGLRNIGGATTTNGLSNTFVDGWLYTSRVTCTDCHGNNDWTATASRGPHGSGQRWLLRGADTAVKVTIASGAVVNNNSNTLATSFCQNCHRSDVYGNGAGNNAATTMYGTLARADHPGSFGSCDADTYQNPYAGCTSCHGGRPSSTGAGTPSGLIHGTSSGAGAEGGDPLGWRFCNGAAWDAHQTGKDGTIGCSTIAATDSYSSCSKHAGFNTKTFTAQYNY